MTVDSSSCSIWFGHLQTSLVAVLLLIGYFIQCFTGFRCDFSIIFFPTYIRLQINLSFLDEIVELHPEML